MTNLEVEMNLTGVELEKYDLYVGAGLGTAPKASGESGEIDAERFRGVEERYPHLAAAAAILASDFISEGTMERAQVHATLHVAQLLADRSRWG